MEDVRFNEDLEKCANKSQTEWNSYFSKWEKAALAEAAIPEEELNESDETVPAPKKIKRPKQKQRKRENVTPKLAICDESYDPSEDMKLFEELLKKFVLGSENMNIGVSMFNILKQTSISVKQSLGSSSMQVSFRESFIDNRNSNVVAVPDVPSRVVIPEWARAVSLMPRPRLEVVPYKSPRFSILNKPFSKQILERSFTPLCKPLPRQASYSDSYLSKKPPRLRILSSDEDSDEEGNTKRCKLDISSPFNSRKSFLQHFQKL